MERTKILIVVVILVVVLVLVFKHWRTGRKR
jgi:predicted RND superfamily exporter protein